MKRILPLLLLVLLGFGSKMIAQTSITCNAAFNFTVNSFTAQFNPEMVGEASNTLHYWIFGDGSNVSVVSPSHVYSNPGIYQVKHIIIKKNSNAVEICRDSVIKTITIEQLNCNLIADFNWNVTNTNVIGFHNLSTPFLSTDSIKWTFGDGTSSYDINPNHTYLQPGTYTVCIRVKKNTTVAGTPACVREICKTVIINPVCNLVANFNWTITNNNTVEFHNLSTPILATDSVKWGFGDGTYSNNINAVHTYLQPGTYTVCLRVKKNNNAPGTDVCVREICKTIVINPDCNLVANFNWTTTSANLTTIAFQNFSTPFLATDSIKWTFGDGTSSTAVNPTHTYLQPGTYNVCIRVKKNITAGSTVTCVKEFCKTIIIGPTCNLVANFGWSSSGLNNTTVSFQNLSSPFVASDSIKWTFGDGTSSTAVNPIHTFSQPGNYQVCIRVKRNSTVAGSVPCVREFCKIVAVPNQYPCDSFRISYNYQRDPIAHNKIYFNAIANATLQSQSWSITRLSASTTQPPIILNQNNPSFVFQDTGSYRVCLKAISVNGCIREYCNVIRIEQLTNNCELQSYPNPTHDLINVSVSLLQPQIIHAYVYNSQNIKVREKHQQGNIGNNIVTINVNDLLPGMYIIKIIYGSKVCYTRFNKI